MPASHSDTKRWSLWLDGRSDPNDQRECSAVFSPVDGSLVAHVEQARDDDVDRAVEVASAAATAYERTPRHQRASWLIDAAERFDAVRDSFAESLVTLIGKPRKSAEAEARRGSVLLRRCAAELSSLVGETLPLDAMPGGEGRVGMTWREPLGVVVAITPFNAPINLMMQKVAPALAMGNAVIVKPAPETAVVTLQVIEAISGAFPAGLLNVVCGGAEVATHLVGNPRVNAVSLTGGAVAGESVLRSAGIKPVFLELGSNSPNLVLQDADLEDAAKRLAQASFSASGQQCISAQRIIVDHTVESDFLEKFVAETTQLVVGDPNLVATDLGPVAHRRARDRIVALIDDADQRGARILLDGRRDGLYLAPTIIVDPPAGTRILSEEVFGPVVVVITSRSLTDAIATANSVGMGLQAGCFTHNTSDAFRVANELHAGSVWVNEASRFRLDTYPFGGVGRSGIGREGVRYAMEELSLVKFMGIRI